MNLLVVHEVNYLKKVVYEFQEIPEALAARGHRVWVADFGEGEGAPPLWRGKTLQTEHVKRSSVAATSSGITLVRFPQLNLPFLARLSALWTHYRGFADFLERQPIDAVFLYSAPTNGWSVLAEAKARKIPVVFRSIDILHHLRHPLTRSIVYAAERWVYRRADRIAALTPALGRYAVKLGSAPDAVEVIAPVVDTEFFKPGPRSAEFRQQWGIPAQAKVLLFLGTFYAFSGLEYVLEHFAAVVKRCPDAHLVVVGGGVQERLLQVLAARESLQSKVTLVPFRPFSEMPLFIREADLAVNPFRLCPATLDIVPTKILQYLSCGLPVLATPLPGTREILPEQESGVVYAPLEHFPARMIDLLEQPQTLAALSRCGRAFITAHHTQGRQIDALETLFKELQAQA